MARNWYIMLSHMLAHIQPALTTGTEVAGFPIGNIRTLRPNQRARVTDASLGGGFYGAYIDFDRATATNIGAINAWYVAGCSYTSGDRDLYLYSGTTSTPATLEGSVSLDALTAPQFQTFTGGALRYWRIALADQTGSATYEVGVATAGYAYSIPAEVIGSTFAPASDPRCFRSVSLRCRAVPIATGKAIMAAFGRRYILRTDNTEQDGFGCDNGALPFVVGYFDTGATTATDAWFGPGSVTLTEDSVAFCSLSITVQDFTLGPLN